MNFPAHPLRPGLLLACTMLCAAAMAAEPPYPNRPVRLVVPYAPGGGTDILGRAVASKVSERLGQQIVVDNRAGGGTIVGTDIVAKSAPDGYTMLMNSVAMIINPSLHAKLPFDVQRDFAPVMMVATLPNILVVHPSLPVRTVRELLDHAKAKPGTLNFGSSGEIGRAHV